MKAKIRARGGDAEAAARLAQQALATVEPTDFPFLHAFVLTGLAEVLRRNGHEPQADDAVAKAVALAQAKGFLVGVERARAVMASA